MLESKHQPIAPVRVFRRRIMKSVLYGMGILFRLSFDWRFRIPLYRRDRLAGFAAQCQYDPEWYGTGRGD